MGGDKDDGKILHRKRKKRGCDDITDNWYPYSKPGSHVVEDADEVIVNGVAYRVDGRNVQLSYSPHEKEIAELLEREVGGELKMLPKVNDPQGVKTADYLFHGKEYDLKTLEKKAKSGGNRIFNPIKKARAQAKNFIIDVTRAELSEEVIASQVEKIFWSNNTLFVDELVIIQDNKIKKVLKRKR